MVKKIQINKKGSKVAFTHAALIFACIITFIPIAATVFVSFKEDSDIFRIPPNYFPCDTSDSAFNPSACRWTLEGYKRVINPTLDDEALLGFRLLGNMFRVYLPNSLLYSVSTSFFVMLLSSLGGFAVSRFDFKLKDALMAALMAVTGVPYMINAMGLYQIAVNMRKTIPFWDDRFFLVLVYCGFFIPIGVWITRGFFDAIPRELEEAAIIDGTTRLGALFRITMPLALPGMMSVFLLTFVSVWNEFIVAYLLVAKNEYKPAMFGLYEFLSQNVIRIQVLAVACILIALPIVLLFLFTRKTFFRAVAEGAVKG